MNYRKIGDDILNDWFVFREDTVLAYTDKEDRKHTIEFDEISELILKNIPKQNRKFVQKQLNALLEKSVKLTFKLSHFTLLIYTSNVPKYLLSLLDLFLFFKNDTE